MKRGEQYSLLLLAGGKSSRMGKNKAELQYEGKTFAEFLIDKVQRLGIEEVYVSGFSWNGEGTSVPPEKIHVVWDQYPDRGPLGGLHACMKAMQTPFCLVLPVDAPRLPQKILDQLLHYHETCREGLKTGKESVLIWEHDDRKEPLIAIYPTEMADEIGNLIQEHSAPVFRMLDRWGYESYRLEMDRPQVINVNTPELYEELLRTTEK